MNQTVNLRCSLCEDWPAIRLRENPAELGEWLITCDDCYKELLRLVAKQYEPLEAKEARSRELKEQLVAYHVKMRRVLDRVMSHSNKT